MSVHIRRAAPGDGLALRDIERLAGERFRDVGLGAIADHEPPSLQALARYTATGRCWVAHDDADGVIGYVLIAQVDENAHIEQISVRPDHQGAGVGRALINSVVAWATQRRMPGVTLTAFADVPWNAPLYEHVGFRVLTEHEIGPELRRLRAAEAANGLDPAIRVCMRLARP